MSGEGPEPGRRSRPWSATGGRVQRLGGESGISLDTQVTAVPAEGSGPAGSHYDRIVVLCRTARAVAELAAHLRLPVGITGALVSQLRDEGLVATRAPLDLTHDGVVTDALLRRVRDRLRNAI